MGLISLFEKLAVKTEQLDEKTIGFQIAPRLNALGRLGDATPGVQLLTTFDEEEASQIVTFMQNENEKRQSLVNQIVEEAKPFIDTQKDQPLLLLAHKGWHEGVLGIVASRIVEQTGKPTLVLSISEDGLTAKGSGRSVGEFNLYDALTSVKDQLVKFGGHHMAAGLTIETVLLPSIMKGLESFAQKHLDLLTAKPVLNIDEWIAMEDVDVNWIESLSGLKPYGTDNDEPVVAIKGIDVQSVQLLGSDKNHLKVVLKDKTNHSLQALAFGRGNWSDSLQPETPVQVVGTLEINEWQNNRLPQLMIKDITVEGSIIIDWRTSKISNTHLSLENTLYLATNPEYVAELEKRIPDSSKALELEAYIQGKEEPNVNSFVLFDLPKSMEVVTSFFKMSGNKPLYIISYTKNSIMTMGIPDKAKFGLVYKYIQSHSSIPYNDQLVAVAHYLKIPLEQFRVILKVFFELEFVKIVDGQLMIHESPKTNNLEESTLLSSLKEQLSLEQKFNYSQFQELKRWIDSFKG